MVIKFHTIQDPPSVMPEPKSELPDMCRQSDNIELPTLIERFIASGAKYTEYMSAQALSAEEKEALFNGEDVSDLEEMDIVEQKDFIDNVVAMSSKVQEQKKKEPTQTKSEPEQAQKDEQSAEEAK